jgi:hypothetical protein
MEPKRRLPVLKEAGGDARDPPRAPWQWIAFGALAIVAVWVPLAWLSLLAAVRMGATGGVVAPVLVLAAGLAVAALAGGYLLGRWGTAGVGTREAALAAVVAALAATALAWSTGGASIASLATVVIAVPPAALGARLGLRRRQ